MRNQKDLRPYVGQSLKTLGVLYHKKKISGAMSRPVLGPRYITFDVKLADPTRLKDALALSESIALGSGSPSVIGRRELGVVRYDIALPQELWRTYHASDISGFGIGVASGNTIVKYDPSDYPNTMVAGTPDSGKSVTLAVMLLALMRSMRADEVSIGLIDPHGTIDIVDGCPHLIGKRARSADEISTLFERFHSEMKVRIKHGEAHIRGNPRLYPRWVLAIDEASSEYVFGDHQCMNHDNLHLARRLVQEGRKCRMNMLFSTQKPSERNMPGVFSQMNNRYVGLVSDARISSNLSGQVQVNAHRLTGRGDFLHVRGAHMTRFQVALPTADDFEKLKNEYQPQQSQIDTSYGRPKTGIEPEKLAMYLLDDYSIADSKRLFGFGRSLHQRYKDFANSLTKELEGRQAHVERIS